jgi:DNA-binding MarR family transcriptional regulator
MSTADNAGSPTDEELVASWGALVDGLQRAQHRVLEAVEADGVPAQWFTVLHVLLRAEGHRLPMGRLAAELSMTGGGFTKLADRIAREGLIDRRNSAGDRRVVYAELTEDGLRMARRSEAIYREQLRVHILGVLSPDDVAQFDAVGHALAAAHPRTVSEEPEDLVRTERPQGLPDRRRRGRDRPETSDPN